MADYSGRPSRREKDLVDLVIIAKTQTVSADSLKRAVDAEARARSLIPFTELTIPPTWGRRYAKEAKDVPYCADCRTVDLAGRLMSTFINMVLHDEVSGKSWTRVRSPGFDRWRVAPVLGHFRAISASETNCEQLRATREIPDQKDVAHIYTV